MPVRLADTGCHFETVQTGHVDVEQHQVGPDEGKLLYGHTAVSYIGDVVPLLFEEAFQQQGVLQVIVGKKNLQSFHTGLYLRALSPKGGRGERQDFFLESVILVFTHRSLWDADGHRCPLPRAAP